MKILKYGTIIVVTLLTAAIGFMSCGGKGGTLSSIRVAPTDPTISTGTNQRFIALAIFSDGTTIDWTTAAIWSTSNAVVAIGNSLGSYGLATSVVTGPTPTGTFTITATDTANNISGTATLYVTDPQSIAITPANPFMAIGTSHQFTGTATLLLSDLTNTTTQNITSFATWTTTNAIATVSSPGLITTGTTTGTTSIRATAPAGGAFDATTLTVTDTPLASITVTPTNPSISTAITTTLQFSATGNYPTSTPTTQNFTQSVIWSSSNTGVATISNTAGTNGLATALATGATGTTSTTITATDPITGHSISTTLSVTP